MPDDTTDESAAPVPENDGLDRYQLFPPPKRGGMGLTYEAVLKGTTGQKVAIKMLLPKLAGDEGAEKRFANERRILVILNGAGIKNIPTFHTDGRSNGSPYLVMNWVEGQSLNQFCQSRTHSVRDCLDLMVRVAEIVARVHPFVVHGDIKPSNILIGKDGTVTLIDFGIAGTQADLENVFLRFGTGFSEGYSAPEQLSEPLKNTNDIYSLGRTLHYMLTGSVREEVRPREPSEANSIAPWIPGSNKKRRKVISKVDKVVLKATDPIPARRYQSAEDLIKDLRQCRKKLSPGSEIVGVVKNWSVLVPVMTALLLYAAWRIASGTPTVRIDQVPLYDQYGGPDTHETISGVVSGVPGTGYHIVIYVYTGAWHVQPQVGAENIPIVNGKWVTWTHTGQRYLALLVKDDYQPVNPIFRNPPVGSGVIALDQKDGIR